MKFLFSLFFASLLFAGIALAGERRVEFSSLGYRNVATTPYVAPKVIVSITANANQQYVRARIDGSSDLLAAKSGISTWETYEQVDAGDGTVAFRSRANGLFVSVQGGDILTATASAIGPWEKFTVVNLGDGYVALRSMKNNLYVCAESGGSGSLVANRSGVGAWERFVVSQVVDIWEAASAFGMYFPATTKLISYGGGILEHREELSGGYLWMVELMGWPGQYWPGGGAEPVWNKYGLSMVGDWEVFESLSTVPEFNSGSSWRIPRAVRYLIPYISQESPHVTAPIYTIGTDSACTQTVRVGSSEEWGNHSVGYLLSMGGDIGVRWVIDLQYKSFGEIWTIDLGPSIGTFAPVYGVVGYTDGNFNRRWFANLSQNSAILGKNRCER